MNGLYGTSQQRMSQPLIGMPTAFNWHTMPTAATTPLNLTTTSAGSLQQSRPSSNTGPLHSPLTAYSADALRTHSGQSLDVADGTYSLQQPSPAEQMLPECASTEPSKSIIRCGMYTTSIFSHYSCACTPFKVCGCPVLHIVNSVLLIIIVVFINACLSLCMKDMSGHVIEEF